MNRMQLQQMGAYNALSQIRHIHEVAWFGECYITPGAPDENTVWHAVEKLEADLRAFFRNITDEEIVLDMSSPARVLIERLERNRRRTEMVKEGEEG